MSAVLANLANTAAIPDRFSAPPTQLDNTARGYSSTSVWQAKGQIFAPVGTPDAVSAAWTVQTPSGAGIVDIMGAASTPFAGGTVAMLAGYTGNAIDISVTLATVPTTKTITILANGELDALTLQKWIQQADAGTTVTVTKLYDQSGGGNHAVLGSYNGFRIEWDDVLQRYTLVGDVSVNAAKGLSIPATVTVNSRTSSMWAMGRGTNATGSSNPNVGCLGAWNAAVGPIMIINNVALSGPVSSRPSLDGFSTGDGQQTPATNVPLDCQPCIVGVINSATDRKYFCNEDTASVAFVPTNQTFTGGSIGTSGIDSSRFPSMRYIGFAVTSTTPTTAQSQAIRYSAYVRLNIRPQVRNQVFFCGDSRFEGFNAVQGPNLPMAVAARLKTPARIYNLGMSGWTNALWANGTITSMGTSVKTGARNVAVYMVDVNDFIVDNLTAAQSQAAIVTNIAALKTQGFTVILIVPWATTSVTNSAGTRMATLRAALQVPGVTAADYLVDLSTLTPILTPGTAVYYPDGLHGSAALYQMVSAAITPTIDAILAGS